MREALGRTGPWRMVRRRARAHPAVGEGLYLVELPRRRLDRRRPRPQARPHLGFARAEGWHHRFPYPPRCPRLGTAVGPCAGDGDAGGVITPNSLLTRFLPQISLRNLRKLDCYTNRYPLRSKTL